MQSPRELRELAAYHREAAKTAAAEEARAWRVSLAEFLETLATDIERRADHS